MKERLGIQDSVSEKDQIQFYSSWIYGAIQILATIPAYQTKEAISHYLGISNAQVSEMLNFLERAGVVQAEKGKWVTGLSRIHLGSDSFLISKFHTNWRLKAIQSLEKADIHQQLHYSSVVSLSSQDVEILKNQLIKAIADFKSVVKDSPPEVMHGFNLDFFRV